MTALILVVSLTLLVSAMCSLFEATLYSSRVATLEAASETGDFRRRARRFLAMKENIAEPTSAILILNTVANTAGATLAGMFADQILGTRWVVVLSVGLTLAILFLSEILPKTYGAIHWNRIWPWIVWPLSLMQVVLYPAIRFTRRFSDYFTRGGKIPTITQDEIVSMIRLAARSGELSPSEMQLVNAVFQFDDLLTRQVMVGRQDVVFFDVHRPLVECIEVARRTGFTRYPLVRGSLDDVIGLVNIKDLLGYGEADTADLEKLARPLQFVPEAMPISSLLRQMQKTQQHLAGVVDEYGTVVGIVTLENVLEQIVGSVQDEFDREAPELVKEAPGQYLALGGVGLSTLNRRLGVELDTSGVDTLSGLLVSRSGRLLQKDDMIRLEGVVARVLDVDGGRARRVRLSLIQDSDENEEED